MVLRPTARHLSRTVATRRGRGVTLLEMLIAVAILAILAMIATPSMNQMLIANRLAAASNEFLGALNYARSESITRGLPVTVRSAAGSSNFTNGWIIFVDNDRNGTQGTGEILLRNGPALSAPLTLYGTVTCTTFLSNGNSSGCGATAFTGNVASFVVCNGTTLASRSRGILLNAAGRARPTDLNSSGVPLKEDGTTAMTSCTSP